MDLKIDFRKLYYRKKPTIYDSGLLLEMFYC